MIIGQAGSLDLYMYAGGNPVNYVDPAGLEDEDAEEAEKSWFDKVHDAVSDAVVDFLDDINPVKAGRRAAGMTEEQVNHADEGTKAQLRKIGDLAATQ